MSNVVKAIRLGMTRGAEGRGWSGAILFNSAVRCELRRDMRRGIAEGVLAVPAAKTGRGVGKKVSDFVLRDSSLRSE